MENLGERCFDFFWEEVVGEKKEFRRFVWLVNSLVMNREGILYIEYGL